MFRTLAIAALAAPLAMGPALAQTAGDVVVQSQEASEVRGEWILGARVYTPDGDLIGSIEDLILDNDQGNVTAAVVSVGGFLGFGAKQIAVDWSELQIDYDGNDITLGITREDAEAAPEYNFRDRQTAPVPEIGTDTGTGMGTDTGTGMGTATDGAATDLGTGTDTGMGTGTDGAATGMETDTDIGTETDDAASDLETETEDGTVINE